MSLDLSARDVAALFHDAGMFASRASWGAAGFAVLNRANNGKIVVAQHPSMSDLLFKRYAGDVDEKEQTRNFERRVEGAQRLRTFVADHELRFIVVPRKQIVELPSVFARHGTAHVLVVERVAILDEDQTKAAYARIDLSLLHDLCVALHHFRGMDSNVKNLPFTVDGRIALIDTEHWDRASSKSYLHHVGGYLSSDRRKRAKQFFARLEDGDEDRSHHFDDEDTSDSSHDFEDEEDTSSSFSSSSS